MLEALDRFNDRVAGALLWISGIGLITMTLIVGWQVFARYILNASPSWSEQATLLLMIWYALLAAAAGFQQGFHIRIVAGQVAVGPKLARMMRIVIEILVLGTGLMFIFSGWWIAEMFASNAIPSLPLSRFWAYLPIPLAGVFITLFSAVRLAGEIAHPGWTEEPSHDDDSIVSKATI